MDITDQINLFIMRFRTSSYGIERDFNEEYIHLNYNYYDYTNKQSRTIIVHVYQNYIMIPQNSILYGNHHNQNKIMELLQSKIIKLDKKPGILVEHNLEVIQINYVFVQDYKMDKDLKEFFKVVGCVDMNMRNFNMERQLIKNINLNYSKMLDQILHTLNQKDLPKFYYNIFRFYSQTYLGFFIRLIFFDSKYNLFSGKFTLNNIDILLRFYQKWLGPKFLSNYILIDRLHQIKKSGLRINFLFHSGLISKNHYKKLYNLLNHKNKLINNLCEFILPNTTIDFIKEMYNCIEDEDEFLIAFNQTKHKCLIQ
jgi:hypothetical protein